VPDGRPKLKLRCPVCFNRENDVLLLERSALEGETLSLYCIKCGFSGDEARVREFYRDARKKYRLLTTRLTLEELRQR
jgi:hypothetical protein